MSDSAGDEIKKRKRKLRVVRPCAISDDGSCRMDESAEIDKTADTDTSSLDERENKKLLELQSNWIKKMTTEGEMTTLNFSFEPGSSPGSDEPVSNIVRKGSTSTKASEALVELLHRDNSTLDELPEELRSRYMNMVSEFHTVLEKHSDELKRMFEHHIREILMEVHGLPRKTNEENESND